VPRPENETIDSEFDPQRSAARGMLLAVLLSSLLWVGLAISLLVVV
jgi:hypothetical protein